MKNINVTSFVGFFSTILIAFCNYVKMEKCDGDILRNCTTQISGITELSALYLKEKKDFDRLCPSLNEELNCIHKYTRDCFDQERRKEFNRIYNGVTEVVHELCEGGHYQEDFLEHAPCLRHAKHDTEICANQYQSILAKIEADAKAESDARKALDARKASGAEKPSDAEKLADAETNRHALEKICCSLKEYKACTHFTVRRTCGKKAAVFIQDFLDKISISIINQHCDEHYKGEPGTCGERYYALSSATAFTTNITLFIGIIFSTLYSFHTKLFIY